MDPGRRAIERSLELACEGPHGLWLDTDRLYCAADGGRLIALDTDTGETLAELRLPGVPDVIMLDHGLRKLYVAIGEPGLVCGFDTD